MIRETWFSGTLMRFWSYQVASVLPSAASTRVRWASGSAVRWLGSLSMLSAALRAAIPPTAANGMTRAATSSPMSAATATITPRWERTEPASGSRRGRERMASRVRDGLRPALPETFVAFPGRNPYEFAVEGFGNNTHVIQDRFTVGGGHTSPNGSGTV